MLGFNGGLLGALKQPAQPGIWTPNEQSVAQRVGLWDRDLYWDNVSLLLKMNGTNGSNTFTDSSSNAFTVTANGNAQISTTQSKFGGSSGYFDGNGDYLTLNGQSAFAFGTGDFTVELWFYLIQASGQLFDFRPLNTNGAYPVLGLYANGDVSYYVNTQERILAVAGITTATWYHLALTRAGTSTKIFVDGQQVGPTWTDTTNYVVGASRPIFGALGFDPSILPLNGYIDELRITKGIARYTANFTVPSAPFPKP